MKLLFMKELITLVEKNVMLLLNLLMKKKNRSKLYQKMIKKLIHALSRLILCKIQKILRKKYLLYLANLK